MRQKHFPDVIFLMETMHSRNYLVDLQVWLGYDRVFTVNPVGHAGGLAIFCKKSVNIKVLSVNKNLVDCIFQFGNISFFASCVYGPSGWKQRCELWERLSRIGVSRKDSWCVFGDFNEILHNGEKIGGVWRSDDTFEPFNQLMKAGKLEELQSSGDGFTWGGMRNKMWVQTRLDRCFGNKAWFRKFPQSNQVFLDKRGSDHRPVLIHLIEAQEKYRGWFKFDRRFLEVDGVQDCIRNAWSFADGRGNQSVSARVKACRKSLSRLKKQTKMNSKDKITQAEIALEREQSSSSPTTSQIYFLKRELMRAQRDEETYWWQKSKDKWLQGGDRNSRFFHNSVKASRQRNSIVKLVNSNGEEVFSEAEKGEIAIEFYSNLFKSSNPPLFTSWFNDMTPRVSNQMNEELIKPVSEIEIKEALFSINPTKAPGPDGMSALFFQKFWLEIKEQFVREVQIFFERGVLPREWNYTHLCLIPKILEPKSVSDLRPISLCSVIYKTISKIMVRRLKPWMQGLISKSQSAFVSERQIFDNITIAHEMIHSLGKKDDMLGEWMVVKTDMSKAYDRIEWGYLRSLLCAMGFDIRWIDWIMKCVSSVTFSVLINDQAHGMIIPQRGLRQGDPLSPLLFVLCTEGLVHLLTKAESDRKIQGIKFGNTGPSITQMLFADDCLFACKADEEQSGELQEILSRYEDVTGQMVNPAKSSIIFGRGVSEENKLKVKQRMGIMTEGGEGKYLGLPEVLHGSKVKSFSYLKERMAKKVSGWHARTLSQGGKEVLIKAVAAALPVHAMSVYRIPKTIISSLHSIMASFWWSNAEHKRKIHWMSWDKMCLSKEDGGLGFKDLECFNKALLARQVWRIIYFEDSLLAQVLKGKYFEDESMLTASLGSKPSYAWRSLIYGRELLVQGLKRSVGDGRNIKVWSEAWIEDEDGVCRTPVRKQRCFDVNLQVSELIDFTKRRWNRQRLEEIFIPIDVTNLLMNQPVTSESDSWVWRFNKSGVYSVKSGYDIAFTEHHKEQISIQTAQPSLNPLKGKVWRLMAPPKIKVFIWKALSGALSVLDNLKARGMKCDSVCQTCGNEGESVNHVLFSCTLARKIWALSGFPSPQGGFSEDSVYQNVNYLISKWNDDMSLREVTKCFPWTLWYLWKNRNSLLFEGFLFDGDQTCKKARDEAQLWLIAQHMESGIAGSSTHINTLQMEEWRPVESDVMKCNIGMKWSKRTKVAGVAWVLSNGRREVLLHSRRSFGAVESKDEAYFLSLVWAVESMLAHKCLKVHFFLERGMLVNAINRPKAWPSFKFKVVEIRRLLRDFLSWQVVHVTLQANRGASLIANSASHETWFQSYVARGHPRWLSNVFGLP